MKFVFRRFSHCSRGYIMNHIRNSSSSDKLHKIYSNFYDSVNTAVKFIRSGNVVAIPTDTIYGLAVDAQNTSAVRQLYKIKDRDFSKPLSICVDKIDCIKLWGNVHHLSEKFLAELLPGPVTIVVCRNPLFNVHLNPGIEKVAIRIPKCEFVQAVTAKLKTPLALTSANKSAGVSSICVEEFSSMWPYLSAIFDGGLLGHERNGSTIIDLSCPGTFQIVREGGYLRETLAVLQKHQIILRN